LLAISFSESDKDKNYFGKHDDYRLAERRGRFLPVLIFTIGPVPEINFIIISH
jgi:hypothetical protein